MLEKLKQQLIWFFPDTKLLEIQRERIQKLEKELLQSQMDVQKLESLLREVRSTLRTPEGVAITAHAKSVISSQNETNLMRKLVGSLHLDQLNTDSNYLKPLSIKEIEQFNQWGAALAEDHWWKYLIGWAANFQTATAVSNIMKGERLAWFSSGVLDGVLFLRDEVDNRAKAYVYQKEGKEDFDPYQIIYNED